MENIQLTDIFFVDREYSNRHPHMLHRHADVLELLYIFSESGRYIVGNYEYAVTEGDFVICGANIPHGEDPFQNHHIQTYCLVLSGASFAPAENERPIISLGKGNSIGGLLPELYNMFHKQTGYSEVCRHFALGIYFFLQRKFLERAANPRQLKRERRSSKFWTTSTNITRKIYRWTKSANIFLSASQTCRTTSNARRACRRFNTSCSGESVRRKVFWRKRHCRFRRLSFGSASMTARTSPRCSKNMWASLPTNTENILRGVVADKPARLYNCK